MTSLILLHAFDPADGYAACFMTRLMGMRPAVDLSWKALE